MKKGNIVFSFFLLAGIGAFFIFFSLFFDQALLVRKDTVYRINVNNRIVALTFDDGPSSEWTPRILDELKKINIKATFFMTGEHVARYPDIARRIVAEGHDIGIHTYTHHVILDYTMDNLVKEIKDTEDIIKKVTGKTTPYFRPPKAWITAREKKKIKEMGYETILWTLNSKDWVTFDDKYIVKYLVKNMRPGDIVLFHDGGGFFGKEGGNRDETVRSLSPVVDRLREKGYRFVTITELLKERQ